MPKYFIADGEYAKSSSTFTENMRDEGLLFYVKTSLKTPKAFYP